MDVTFGSGGERCAAWLYPAKSPSSPIVLLGHGLGGVREMRLDAFAERFADAGYACLVFDYRHFGSSGGEPRQLLDVKLQLDDWAAAIGYARTVACVDPERVVLWGSSFGGGHVIIAGARDRRVAAIISQCPFTDGHASVRAANPLGLAKATGLALRDAAGTLLRRAPTMIATAGPPGSAALMAAPDAEPGYLALVPEGAPFRNEVAARFALHVGLHRPGKRAVDLRCPALFQLCESDSVAPAKAAERDLRRAPKGEIVTYPYGHFDIYVGAPFEHIVADQLAFLERRVPVADRQELA
ncbi:alpha/beta fold hydrolase [Streptomyces sp. SP18BB07]|nr:alpha/beta fold hydrolase [Streptomyces sp. SP18BB07]MEE1765182.1 alpha/beta fold hydrolase [Streptomyces sp. SP18BB07]